MNDSNALLSTYTHEIDEALRASIPAQDGISLYQHLEYFLGFRDESLTEIAGYGGKRFRSALCLMLGDWYGNKDAARSVATSIELFHNFTLIHDDIVDGDTLRRGRPTVWKLFGSDHAINDGDAQLVLALQHIVNESVLSDTQKVELQSFLLERYLRVVEGQHMDFVLTKALLGDDTVCKEHYYKMITRKSADLVAAATKGAGIAAGVSQEEQQILFDFGLSLGMAYQLYDDMVSIWGTSTKTGKEVHGDLYERKKTLPILHAYESLPVHAKEELLAIYTASGDVTQTHIERISALLNEAEAYIYTKQEIESFRAKTEDCIAALSVTQDQKNVLRDLVSNLLPEIQ